MKELTREQKLALLEQLKEEVKRPTGRPKAEVRKDAQLGIRVQDTLKTKLQKKAKAETRTMSSVCEYLIEKGLEKEERSMKVKRLPQDGDQKVVELPVVDVKTGDEKHISLHFDRLYQVIEIKEWVEGFNALLHHKGGVYFTHLGNWEK